MNPKPLSTGKIVGLVVLGVLIILVLWVMGTYNSLVSLNENAKTAQSDVEVQYERRFALIPNLVETAKGIAGLEQSVFTSLAEARSKYAGTPAQSNERIAAMNQFDTSLSRLLVIVENYPVLKSAESFLKLQDQLEGTENRISVARNQFNATVNQLNKKIQFFPSNLIAGIFGFQQRDRFEATEAAAKVPEVKFDFK
ncbi:LemA family protein [Candidatus Peregrinibacteria bacterium]|nr:LemA family protein [Candidatus Peregrinibacteria bacterium]